MNGKSPKKKKSDKIPVDVRRSVTPSIDDLRDATPTDKVYCVDSPSYSYQVTDEHWRMLCEHELDGEYDQDADSYREEFFDNFDLHIKYDDTNRSKEEAIQEEAKGFIAEAVFATILDDIDADYEWEGGKGVVDFDVHGHNVDVKARQSDRSFKFALKDYEKAVPDIDIWMYSIVGYDHNGEIQTVTFKGWMKDDEIDDYMHKTLLYNNDTQSDDDTWESQKGEMLNNKLRDFLDFINLYK